MYASSTTRKQLTYPHRPRHSLPFAIVPKIRQIYALGTHSTLDLRLLVATMEFWILFVLQHFSNKGTPLEGHILCVADVVLRCHSGHYDVSTCTIGLQTIVDIFINHVQSFTLEFITQLVVIQQISHGGNESGEIGI